MSFVRRGTPASADSNVSLRLLPGGSSTVMIGLGAITVLLFVLTTFVASAYHRMQEGMGRHWFQRGQNDLQAGRPQAAVNDFRNALAYARKRDYLLNLAQSLAATGNDQEARGYLLSLWDQQPGSGILNLELARLSARTGRADDAIRYYQNAIYGVWSDNPPQQRRTVRLELAHYLLGCGDKSGAEADLIALLPDLPNDAASHSSVADLFVASGNLNRALQQYEEALKIDHNFDPALTGAGETAFSLGNYQLARHYLERAVRQNRSNAKAADTLQVTEFVLNMDPLASRLRISERARRLNKAQMQVISRIRDCAEKRGLSLNRTPSQPGDNTAASTTPQEKLAAEYDSLTAKRSHIRERDIRANPDMVEDVMSEIVAAENAATAVCGAPAGPDLALILIARIHGMATP